SVLFETPVYKGNAVAVHQHLHELAPFTKAHFNQWLLLFNQTTDQLFSGNMAEKIKQRAQSIATIISLKTIYKWLPVHRSAKLLSYLLQKCPFQFFCPMLVLSEVLAAQKW
ncbi:group III truncated hemoglobin, partial [Streptomyces sp. UMAF16]|nr:group III truncated hemoglobin [Streptomyces sp. UMAF16]